MEVKMAAKAKQKTKKASPGCLMAIVIVMALLVLSVIISSEDNTDVNANPYKIGLHEPIGEEEAIETCVNRLAHIKQEYPPGESLIYIDWFPGPRDKAKKGEDAWHIEKEGAIRAKASDEWQEAMFYCEVPFERIDIEETYSAKNVRKIDYLGP